MLFLIQNQLLTDNTERTSLTSAISVGGTSLTVRAIDANSWADNDWIILGEIGTENAELLQINGAVSDGTSLTIDDAGSGGTRYAHSADEPVYRISYNQVKISRATTEEGTKTALTTVDIQPNDFETRYDDIANTTGFGFAAFFNSVNSNQSPYSDAIPYATQSDSSLTKLIGKVRTHLYEKDDNFVKDSEIIEALNTRQRDIINDRLWTFNEIERTQSSVADQFDYDIDSNIKTLHTCRFDSQPLKYKGRAQWELLNYDTDVVSDTIQIVTVFNNDMRFYPRPASSANADTLNGAIAAGDTSIAVTDASGFKRSDYYRFIIEDEVIYATAVDTTTNTFSGCKRGQEETTAASHADTTVVTERNIVYTGQKYATDLENQNDETIIPEPDLLAYGAAADLATGKLKDVSRGDRFEVKYESQFQDLKNKFSLKFSSQMGRVKTIEETGFMGLVNPNDYPTNIQAS